MKPTIAFVLEQSLGHVAYGRSLRKILSRRTDMTPVWLEIPFEPGWIGRVPGVGSNWTLRGSARTWFALQRTLAQRPIDALFINTQTIGLFAGSTMRRVPTLLSLDATPRNYDEVAAWYGDRVHSPPVERAKLWAHRSVMKEVSWFTTWSQWAKQSLVAEYGVDEGRITVLRPGTILADFPLAEPRKTDGPLTILFVGGDLRRKGGDLLADICRTRLRGRVELHLVTGSGDVTSGEGIYVHRGLRPHSPELLELYRRADLFVLPTRADCLAVVLGEAMVSGLPIITTRVGAHAEVVRDGENGYLIEKDDADALEDRIRRLLADRDLLRHMAVRSRQIGETLFDGERNADQIADRLIQLATSRASGSGKGRAERPRVGTSDSRSFAPQKGPLAQQKESVGAE